MADKYRDLKNAFGKFSTGIVVAACKTPADDYRLLTVNSFASVSLDPPLVLWCIETKAKAFPQFMEADHYAVSILPSDAEAISNRFAGHAPAPLTADEYEVWRTGAPILKSRLAGFDCRIIRRHREGDHVILIGEVLQFDSRDGEPLVYFSSQYHRGV